MAGSVGQSCNTVFNNVSTEPSVTSVWRVAHPAQRWVWWTRQLSSQASQRSSISSQKPCRFHTAVDPFFTDVFVIAVSRDFRAYGLHISVHVQRVVNFMRVRLREHAKEEKSTLTPSLRRPVKILGWKMHGRACNQYISGSYNASTFNAMRSDKNTHANAKQKTKKVSDFALLLVAFKWEN